MHFAGQLLLLNSRYFSFFFFQMHLLFFPTEVCIQPGKKYATNLLMSQLRYCEGGDSSPPSFFLFSGSCWVFLDEKKTSYHLFTLRELTGEKGEQEVTRLSTLTMNPGGLQAKREAHPLPISPNTGNIQVESSTQAVWRPINSRTGTLLFNL